MWWKDASQSASAGHAKGSVESSVRSSPQANGALIGASGSMVAPSGKTGGEVRRGEDLGEEEQATARPTSVRTNARRLCMAAGLGVVLATSVLAGVALSSSVTAVPSGIVTVRATSFDESAREGDVTMTAADHEVTANPRTADLIAWFSARGLLRAVGFDLALRVDRVTAEVVPAPGVELPSAPFSTRGIRFNEAGEIIEILPAAADEDTCELFILFDSENPRHWTYFCEGTCTAPQECILGIDLTTLEVSCACIP
jgi:hypothetical protein